MCESSTGTPLLLGQDPLYGHVPDRRTTGPPWVRRETGPGIGTSGGQVPPSGFLRHLLWGLVAPGRGVGGEWKIIG